jgi:hypothetical protein
MENAIEPTLHTSIGGDPLEESETGSTAIHKPWRPKYELLSSHHFATEKKEEHNKVSE